jgi:hypothetical protein
VTRILPFLVRRTRRRPLTPRQPDWLDASSGLRVEVAMTISAPTSIPIETVPKDPDDVDAPPRPRSE